MSRIKYSNLKNQSGGLKYDIYGNQLTFTDIQENEKIIYIEGIIGDKKDTGIYYELKLDDKNYNELHAKYAKDPLLLGKINFIGNNKIQILKKLIIFENMSELDQTNNIFTILNVDQNNSNIQKLKSKFRSSTPEELKAANVPRTPIELIAKLAEKKQAEAARDQAEAARDKAARVQAEAVRVQAGKTVSSKSPIDILFELEATRAEEIAKRAEATRAETARAEEIAKRAEATRAAAARAAAARVIAERAEKSEDKSIKNATATSGTIKLLTKEELDEIIDKYNKIFKQLGEDIVKHKMISEGLDPNNFKFDIINNKITYDELTHIFIKTLEPLKITKKSKPVKSIPVESKPIIKMTMNDELNARLKKIEASTEPIESTTPRVYKVPTVSISTASADMLNRAKTIARRRLVAGNESDIDSDTEIDDWNDDKKAAEVTPVANKKVAAATAAAATGQVLTSLSQKFIDSNSALTKFKQEDKQLLQDAIESILNDIQLSTTQPIFYQFMKNDMYNFLEYFKTIQFGTYSEFCAEFRKIFNITLIIQKTGLSDIVIYQLVLILMKHIIQYFKENPKIKYPSVQFGASVGKSFDALFDYISNILSTKDIAGALKDKDRIKESNYLIKKSDYLQKYLKYKQKYLQLKKNIFKY